MEGKKPSHLLFYFSHVSRRQDLQEAGMMARFWYRSCFPFIGLGALMPAASESSSRSWTSGHLHLVNSHGRAEVPEALTMPSLFILPCTCFPGPSDLFAVSNTTHHCGLVRDAVQYVAEEHVASLTCMGDGHCGLRSG